MTWVPPFFTCGECGGEIGLWPMLNLLRQEILDWRHRTVPQGTQPHRAVLGTPAHDYVIVPAKVEEGEEEVVPDPVPPPTTPAQRVNLAELEAGPSAALSLQVKAQENGWQTESWYMVGPHMDARWKFVRTVESVVVRLLRDGHGLTASWKTKADQTWAFDDAYSLGHVVEPLASAELRAAVGRPRMICESCGEPPALHVSTNTGPVCFTEFHTEP